MELSRDFVFTSFPDVQTAACFAVLAYSEEEPRRRYLAGESNEVSGLWLTPIGQLSDAGRSLILDAFSDVTVWEASPDAKTLCAEEARDMYEGVTRLLHEIIDEISKTDDHVQANHDKLVGHVTSVSNEITHGFDVQMPAQFDAVRKDISSSATDVKGSLEAASNSITADVISSSNRVIQSNEKLVQTEVEDHEALTDRLETNVAKLTVDLNQNLQALAALDQRVYASLNNWLAEAIRISSTEAPLIVAMARFIDAGGIDSMTTFSDAIREANRLTDDLQAQIKILSDLTSLNDTAVNSQKSLQSDIKMLIERDQFTKKVSNVINSAGLMLKGADLALKLNSQKGGL